MANDSSLGGAVGANVFNFDTQKGVTNLLASLRASSLSPEQKNELRDLVFQYMNGGKDQTVRIALENKISTYGITPITTPEKKPEATPPPSYEFGTSRPAPTFTPVSSVSTPVSSVPTQEPAVTPTPQTVPVAMPEPVVVPATPVVEQAATQPASAPEPVAVTPQPAPTPVTPPPVTPASSAEPELTQEASQGLQRIKEIKSLVNEKIGNPVNLVDINNEVGREYMSAMLDAMKKLNTGSSAVSAMKRLEDAYIMVEKTLAEQKAEPEIKAVAETTPEPVVEKPLPPVQDLEPPVVAEPTEKPVTTEPEPLEPTPTPAPLQTEPEVAPVSEPVPIVKAEEATVSPEPVTAPVVEESVQNNEESSPWESEVSTVPASSQAHSLAETKTKLKTPDDLPLSSAIETSSVAGDPLFTKEVDEGLQQLLSEWSIFKKSGFFGTGPNGRQHPLFLKIASLQIPLLLAGRFEGATQEIKQSITDYMNGWRYEQGIIYEHGENFEHYLRRVIKHIIDLQKKKRTS